ncbi:MAG: HNH endonuclease [Chitinispirillales bacterium]|jgi:glycosyltransferase involved in cell wall biosynthesis|nr:HNH endonuclease [Chitinispirillales bacterium]
MPPPAIKTIKQIIFYQYAKIVSSSSGFGKKNYAMIMSTYKKLCSGDLTWSSARREWQKEFENPTTCIYCGEEKKLTTEHILPISCGGEDIADNAVRVCASCNSSKGGKRLYEWRGLDAKDEHHRIAEGKYLKYLYSLHEKKGTLDKTVCELCPSCNLGQRCQDENKVGKLTVYCIEGCFQKE